MAQPNIQPRFQGFALAMAVDAMLLEDWSHIPLKGERAPKAFGHWVYNCCLCALRSRSECGAQKCS